MTARNSFVNRSSLTRSKSIRVVAYQIWVLLFMIKLGPVYVNRWSTTTMIVPPSRLAVLKQLRCSIFQTSYNPQSLRTGAKYFRARLRGPSMSSYYPLSFDIAKIARQYPDLEMVNDDEEERLQDVLDRKRRGKGPPKKAKSKGLYSHFCFLHAY